MPKYNVHHYLVFRVRIDDVEAESHDEAVVLSAETAWELGNRNPNSFEFSDEQVGALVDVVGDDEYTESKYLDAFAVNEAEDTHYLKQMEKQNVTRT